MRETPRPRGRVSLEEYLAFEERSPLRHEYVAGEVYAMSGGTTRHSLITLNLARHLYAPARRRGCRVFSEIVKVKAADRIYYPDLIVACGAAAEVEQIVAEPSLIAEVTSRSTRAIDRREKLDAYQRIPSLRAYLIVDQRRKHVLAYTRDDAGEWQREEYVGVGEIPIPFLSLRLAVEEIYDDVPLPPLSVKEGEEEWDAEEWEEAWAE